MQFFIGLHHPSTAWPFKRAMIQVATLCERLRDFRVNEWILDSGAFSQISRHGRYRISPDEYLRQIERWSGCGELLCACTQDWMCEPFIVEKTGLSIREHQERTIDSYVYLSERSSVYIMPILQGFEPADYVKHLDDYAFLIPQGAWVGVGSVCRRNVNSDAIEDVLVAIKSRRADLCLHGFGLKITAFESPTVRALLYSSDSMAWSLANKFEQGDGNDPRRALAYCAKVEALSGEPCFIQDQLFQWWA
jgi:hypothetical protein